MKKFFLLALLCFSVISCGDDIESNTPSIQGEVDTYFFRATNSSAMRNPDGSVTLMGTSSSETVTLKAEDLEVGSYELGVNSQNEASFETFEGEVYFTGSAGDGEIIITRIENGTLSGEFYFNALRNGTGDTLNFNKGSFFDVPLTQVTTGEDDNDEN